jgi:hypothetical protein
MRAGVLAALLFLSTPGVGAFLPSLPARGGLLTVARGGRALGKLKEVDVDVPEVRDHLVGQR